MTQREAFEVIVQLAAELGIRALAARMQQGTSIRTDKGPRLVKAPELTLWVRGPIDTGFNTTAAALLDAFTKLLPLPMPVSVEPYPRRGLTRLTNGWG